MCRPEQPCVDEAAVLKCFYARRLDLTAESCLAAGESEMKRNARSREQLGDGDDRRPRHRGTRGSHRQRRLGERCVDGRRAAGDQPRDPTSHGTPSEIYSSPFLLFW